MKLLSQIISYGLPVLYLVVLYIYYLTLLGKHKSLEKNTTRFLIGLLLIHALNMVIRNVALKTIPLSTIFDAFSFLAFSILIVYTILESSLKNRGSGLFILSFAFILEIISTLNYSWAPETNELLQSPVFALHASMSIMGYTALSLSAIYALMYIVQDYNLKSRNLGKLFMQLPAVTYLEKMSIKAVFIGIILLGIGLLMGHIMAIKAIGSFWPKDVKVVVSDLVWIIYVIGYFFIGRLNWRGERMAYFSVIGYVVLVIGGLIVINLSESFHAFY